MCPCLNPQSNPPSLYNIFTHILKLCEYHLSEYQWDCSRPSPIGNPFHTSVTANDVAPSAKDRTDTIAAFSTAMYSVPSDETSTFAAIATVHNLPATSIRPPYKDMSWTLYANNFKRTLSRLQLYRLSLNRQNPNKATIHLRLMSDSDPSSSHLQPIVDWLDTGSLPPGPSFHTTPKPTSPQHYTQHPHALRFRTYPNPPDSLPSTFSHQHSSPATPRPNLHSVPLTEHFYSTLPSMLQPIADSLDTDSIPPYPTLHTTPKLTDYLYHRAFP